MSAADFLFAPEVQKLLKVLFAEPAGTFSVAELAKRAKLDAADVERTQAHLVSSGILLQSKPEADTDAPPTVGVNLSFVFYNELRAIALKSFAAAEPIRAMLRSKFKDSVLRAFVLGEDRDGTIELLVVHGQHMPDETAMAAACQKLSASIGRHLKVQVISARKFTALDTDEGLRRALAAGDAFEILTARESKAKPHVEPEGFLRSATKRFWR